MKFRDIAEKLLINRKDIADILKKYDLLEYDEFDLLRESHGILPIDNLIFI